MSKDLFNGEFEYEDINELYIFLDNLDPVASIEILEIALNHANKQGAFDILESHCIHKCLEKLKKDENKDSDLHNIDNNGDSN